MISHEYRCIFVHIPRTGGTSIERAFVGEDEWLNEAAEKHLIASQAKQLYKDYWNSYFKFSIVRDPFSRMLSCLKFGGHFSDGVRPGCKFSDFLRGYMRRWGFPITLEYDNRFSHTSVSPRGLPNAVYLNMLDEELDYIGKFEQLDQEFVYIAQVLNATNRKLGFYEVAQKMPIQAVSRVDAESIELLEGLFRRDLERFDYELPTEGFEFPSLWPM